MKIIFTLMLFTFICIRFYGQVNVETKQITQAISNDTSIVKAAGPQYAASGWKNFWWGKHYRREWTTPVSFPVLHISSIDGGLTPLKVGGGHESKSLRLLSANGREYVLRTMDKSVDALVPEEFKGTFLNDILNDQISTAHPYGPIAISRMAEAISIPHTNPEIFYVPDDTAFHEFRNIFANRLALLEERPSGKGWEHSDLFANADGIVNTRDMAAHVFASTRYSVDQQAFLKVRFFDMIINDWDRHEDQWVWAEEKTGKQHLYIPIGRDRDQAFSKTDGFGLYLASRPWYFRSIKDFTPNIKDISGQNFLTRNLDQNFLNELTKEDWQHIVNSIQTKLTDSAMVNAVQAMPAEVNQISGDWVIKRLEERRNNLSDYGMRYYSVLAKKVTITGAQENESFVVDLNKKNEVGVTGLRSGQDTFYHRVFERHDTKEINIYALGGNDEYLLRGNAKNNFTIRFIGGDGNNSYKAEQSNIAGKRVSVYDSLQLTGISYKDFKVNRRWDTLYRYNPSSAKFDWYMPVLMPGYNQDDGVSVSLGLLYKKQQWGKSPFGWQQRFTVDYATGTKAVGFGYKGVFKSTFEKWDVDLNSFYKGPRYTLNYYGLGNETELYGYPRSFFRVKANNFYISPGTSRTWKWNYLRFGLQYESVKILTSQDKFVITPQAKVDSNIFSANHYAGVNGEWNFFNAGDENYPTKGFHFNTSFSYTNNLNNTDRNLLKINGAATVYYTFAKRLTFAHRTGAGTNFGDYEFYQANTLGSNKNLRGFWRDRFAGKTNFYQNTELRYNMFNLKGYVVRGRLGVFGFFDDGRVWVEDDNSSTLHTGYGGGIFLAPYNQYSFNVSYSTSKEASMITVRAGFLF